MKNLLAVILALGLLLCLAACRDRKENVVTSDEGDVPSDHTVALRKELEDTYWYGVRSLVYSEDSDVPTEYTLPNEDGVWELFLFSGGKARLLRWSETFQNYYLMETDYTWRVEMDVLVLTPVEAEDRELYCTVTENEICLSWGDPMEVCLVRQDMPPRQDAYREGDLYGSWYLGQADAPGREIRLYWNMGSMLLDYTRDGQSLPAIGVSKVPGSESSAWYLTTEEFREPASGEDLNLVLRYAGADIMTVEAWQGETMTDSWVFSRRAQEWDDAQGEESLPNLSEERTLEILEQYSTVAAYLDTGMVLRSDGVTVDIGGSNCHIFSLGTDSGAGFAPEMQLTVDPLGTVYCYDTSVDGWEFLP